VICEVGLVVKKLLLVFCVLSVAISFAGQEQEEKESAADRGECRSWAVPGGMLEQDFTMVKQLAVSRDGHYLAAEMSEAICRIGEEVSCICVWDMALGRKWKSLKKTGPARSIAFSPIANLLALVRGQERMVQTNNKGFPVLETLTDDAICLWDIEKQDVSRELADNVGFIQRIDFSLDGTVLLANGRGWDVKTGKELIDTREFDTIVNKPLLSVVGEDFCSFAISPDRSTVAMVDLESTVALVDIKTGARRVVKGSYPARFYKVIFSPDDRHVAVAVERLHDNGAFIEVIADYFIEVIDVMQQGRVGKGAVRENI
jgi:WD40 repeat protein